MKLAQLLAVYPQLCWGDYAHQDVTNLADDSRKVEKGSVFIAVKGTQADGHNFIKQAVRSGAIAIVGEDLSEVPNSFKGARVRVEDSRLALSKLASRFYGSPEENLFLVGVTGTNGKTSTTYIIEHILNQYGWKTGVMGTVDHHIGTHSWKSELTTPGTLALYKRLSEFVALGARAVVFEVSSHALDQKRADNIPFSAVVFTNLSRDHLDYHENMESYFYSKQLLFNELPNRSIKQKIYGIVNLDDTYGKKLKISDKIKLFSYGQQKADLTFKILKVEFTGSQFSLETPHGKSDFYMPQPGEYNIYNAIAAIGTCLAAGVSLQACKEALETFPGVPGRLQSIKNEKGLYVFVDYAHTDDALKSVLENLNLIRNNSSAGQIVTVFGCGGDRDRGKRPIMMNVAKELSDQVFLTSDNPRTEDPMQIINDALKVVPAGDIDNNIFVESDRRTAIFRAINGASKDDVILIAGKGHEDYQIIGEKIVHFSDCETALEALGEG